MIPIHVEFEKAALAEPDVVVMQQMSPEYNESKFLLLGRFA